MNRRGFLAGVGALFVSAAVGLPPMLRPKPPRIDMGGLGGDRSVLYVTWNSNEPKNALVRQLREDELRFSGDGRFVQVVINGAEMRDNSAIWINPR